MRTILFTAAGHDTAICEVTINPDSPSIRKTLADIAYALTEQHGTSVTYVYDGDLHTAQPNDRISVHWYVEDVHSVVLGLTEEQAYQVLKHALTHHDASDGINWGTLRAAAQALGYTE